MRTLLSFCALLALTIPASGCTHCLRSAILHNTHAITTSTRHLRRSTVATRATAKALDQTNTALKEIQKRFDPGVLDHVINELRFALVVAFLAFTWIVVSGGNEARSRCEDLVRDELRLQANKRKRWSRWTELALSNALSDFHQTYRYFWALVIVISLLLVGFAVSALLTRDGKVGLWYGIYAGGLMLSLLVTGSFYRKEGRAIAGELVKSGMVVKTTVLGRVQSIR